MSILAGGDQEQQRIVQFTRQIELMREAAKQLTGLTAVLPTLYFAVVSFSDLHKVVHGVEALPFLLPALPWLVSQAVLIPIFLPHPLPEETPAERIGTLKQQVEDYYYRLRWASWSLTGGLILLIFILGYYLAFVPPPPNNP